MDEKTLEKGSKAEKCFREGWVWVMYGKKANAMTDETGKRIEGDFRLSDGSTVEVKGDFRCFSTDKPTGNIPIEVYHSGHKDGDGWYQHCMANGVDSVTFLLFRSEDKKQPCAGITVSMCELVEFMNKNEDKYPIRTAYDKGDTIRLRCIPVQDIIANCCESRAISMHPTEETAAILMEWIKPLAMQYLKSIGLDTAFLTLGAISSVQFKPDMGEKGEVSTDETQPQEFTEVMRKS